MNNIRAMFLAGADVFRLNMSHGDKIAVKEMHNCIRILEKEFSRPICILADLQGPKLRCGNFKEGEVYLKLGEKFNFDLNNNLGDDKRVFLPHPEIFQSIEKDHMLLIDDGKVSLKVIKKSSESIECTVMNSGSVSNKKGVNCPDSVLDLAPLTLKDKEDLDFVCDLGVDWIALSFVQRAKDIKDIKILLAGRAGIISKIEKPSADNVFEEILEQSDGIMVARGDLGVELPIEAVPPVQKKLVMKCRQAGKPVIVATQMMESMIYSTTPTRAEVSDVAQAIYDGVDAVMLSAETAIGAHPEKVISTVDKIAIEIEKDSLYFESLEASRTSSKEGVSNAITVAAREVADTVKVRVICCFTHGGTTASLASRERPRVPIIALTPNIKTARRLTLCWGVHCVITVPVDRFRKAVKNAIEEAKKI
jgi:pyruvate kinase